MTINADLQRLEVGNKILLFSVDGSAFGGPELYFHNHTIPYTEAELENLDDLPTKSIWWQGVEYKPWPVRIEGVEVNSDGRTVSPTLSVANLDGTISAMCLAYQNMAQARVTIRMTFAIIWMPVIFPMAIQKLIRRKRKSMSTILTVRRMKTIQRFILPCLLRLTCKGYEFRPVRFIVCVRGVCEDYIENPPVTTRVIVILTKTAIRQMIHQKMHALGYCQQDVSRALGKEISFPTAASPVQR
ncbi:hypothetical protein XBO1_2180002 [Xenorhabdus bovienii str. oregonense]|uniref:Phage minor tail protein L n=1 Tax=Xenorhabdus bovienii str. oregonense TaxID=1398202 RepID=A0A077P607_XENBV|nr:hypothetical protein XBO1_2180002 [Xenorhabdus bovienii str. oregonense]